MHHMQTDTHETRLARGIQFTSTLQPQRIRHALHATRAPHSRTLILLDIWMGEGDLAAGVQVDFLALAHLLAVHKGAIHAEGGTQAGRCVGVRARKAQPTTA